MKKILSILLIAFSLCLFNSCNSDEPEAPYTGPWAIIYSEVYHYMHNSNDDVKIWFDSHSQFFQEAQLYNDVNGNSWSFKSPEDVIYWSDYSEWSSGTILWVEVIDNASEDEIKQKVEQFKAFSIENKVERRYDDYYAEYQRVN